MSTLSYGFETTLPDVSYDDAVQRVTAALQEEGFGILTEIDVKATLKKKIDADFRRYVILGACNPHLAHRALQAEPQIGLLLPCNVVVQEGDDGATLVSIADPNAMFKMVENAELESVAEEVTQKLRRVMAALS